MATAYTPILKLALPVTGELNGTWGDVVNQNITEMVEQAVAGLATINTWAANSHTLTTADGTTSESRCAMLVIDDDGAGNPSAAATVICPAATKPYIVQNICGQTVTVKTSAGTGVAIPNNQSALVFCNGTNVVTGAFNGDVVGPASATDNAIVRYDGTTGKLIQNSVVTIADTTGNMAGVGTLGVGAITTSGALTYGGVTLNNAVTGTGNMVLSNSPTLVTPALGTPASGVVTNLTGTASININGTVGATTPSTVVATQVDITAQGDLRLQDTTGGQYVALQAPGTVASSYTLTLPVDDGTSGQALITDGSGVLSWSTAASGDVYGPASATDNAVARYDGTTGKIIQNSAVTIADDGATVIAANSTTNGLRITQIGTGNALLVEDSANPDATPFVITADGRVVVGNTAEITPITGVTPSLQVQGVSASLSSITSARFSADVNASNYIFTKSRGSTGSFSTSVNSNDTLGNILFVGADGTGGVQAASITAAVDGTPGTNDMPGRLVFSTTADGASSPTERMRIDSAGQVGIGSTSLTGYSLRVAKNLTGAISPIAIASTGVLQSDATGSPASFYSVLQTQATAFTATNFHHFRSVQGALGATSAVTNQFGFGVDSSLTSATNNYGFHSNIASGTGRWNFYAQGTANNFFAGNTLVGDPTDVLYASGVRPSFQLNKSAAASLGISRFSANAASNILVFLKSRGATVGAYDAVVANDALGAVDFYGADGTAGIQAARIVAEVDGTPGTNDMPGRLVFSTTADGASSPTERMRITSGGNVGIGATPLGLQSFVLGKNITGGTTATGLTQQGTVQSDVTAGARIIYSNTGTAAAAFTLTNLDHFRAEQATFGAGSTVTNQFGYHATVSLTGATNNYGFYSAIASGTGRWNFYAAGTAANYFAGDMQLDKTVIAGGTTGAQTINKNAGTVNFAAAATSLVVTDSRVTTDSIIICTVGTNDITLKSVAAVAGAGSFTLHANAAATAETRVNFLIIN
jgi:hypothetical protein